MPRLRRFTLDFDERKDNWRLTNDATDRVIEIRHEAGSGKGRGAAAGSGPQRRIGEDQDARQPLPGRTDLPAACGSEEVARLDARSPIRGRAFVSSESLIGQRGPLQEGRPGASKARR